MKQMLVIALAVVASVASSPTFFPSDAGGPCADDEGCSEGECHGGFCSGPSSCDDCVEGWVCVRDSTDFFFFETRSEQCFQSCAQDADCPATWACIEALCVYPPPSEARLVASDDALVGADAFVSLERRDRAVPIDGAVTWSISPAERGVVVQGDERGATVRFQIGGLATVSATWVDTEGRSDSTFVSVDVEAEHLDRCAETGACIDEGDACMGAPALLCLAPMTVAIGIEGVATTGTPVDITATLLQGDDVDVAFVWQVDDVVTEGDRVLSFAFDDPGTHTIFVTATNGYGVSASAALDVAVCTAPGGVCTSFLDCCADADVTDCSDDGTDTLRCLAP